MKKTLKISKFEIKKIFRNRGIFLLMIIFPIIVAYLGAEFYPEKLVQNYKVAVYNEDNSFLGRFGFLFLKQFFKWENAKEIKNKTQLKEVIREKEFDSILVIPKGFMGNLKDYKETKLYLIPNPDKLQDSMAIYTVFNALFKELSGIPDIAGGSTTEFLLKGGITVDKNRKKPKLEVLVPDLNDGTTKKTNSIDLGFQEIFAPTISVIMVLLFSMIGVGNSIAHTKESGLFDIYRANGLKTYQFIGIKFNAYLVLGIVASFISWYMYRLFGVASQGNEFYVILIILSTVFAFTAFGILISSFVKNERSAAFLLTVTTGAMIVFGDVLLPIPSSSIVKNVSYAFPIKYAVDAWRKVSILGLGMKDIKLELLILILFGIISLIISNYVIGIVEKK
ncbi:ABC transporter permease [Tepiditoga spiralis]|uniref:ABC transporter permease n=1 Tax=Tepiditoga spiralis TaxID=2108365 RepID=A0A7G1G8M8_9BACT|nr:ABC transporter permease [Tepiditoga spiralis]BBE31317.1 ABC transporter permease [Tepiditoga spiralis]